MKKQNIHLSTFKLISQKAKEAKLTQIKPQREVKSNNTPSHRSVSSSHHTSYTVTDSNKKLICPDLKENLRNKMNKEKPKLRRETSVGPAFRFRTRNEIKKEDLNNTIVQTKLENKVVETRERINTHRLSNPYDFNRFRRNREKSKGEVIRNMTFNTSNSQLYVIKQESDDKLNGSIIKSVKYINQNINISKNVSHKMLINKKKLDDNTREEKPINKSTFQHNPKVSIDLNNTVPINSPYKEKNIVSATIDSSIVLKSQDDSLMLQEGELPSDRNKPNGLDIDIQDLILIEERLNHILNKLYYESPVCYDCIDWWALSTLSKVYIQIKRYINDIQLVVKIQDWANFELIAIAVIFQCSYNRGLFISILPTLKKVMFLVHQTFLAICDYIILSVNDTDNIMVPALVKIVKKKYQKERELLPTISNNLNALNKHIMSLLQCFYKLNINSIFLQNIKNLKILSYDLITSIFKKDISYLLNLYPSSKYSLDDKNLLEKFPFIKSKPRMKYTLFLDLDETLIYFAEVIK